MQPEISLFDGKVCSRCKIWQPFCNYSKDSQKLDGLRYFCKTCRKKDKTDPAYTKAYNEANPEIRKAAMKKWADAHKSERNEYNRQRYQNPKIAEKLLNRVKKYAAAHREERLRYGRKWRDNHKTLIAQNHKSYYPGYYFALKASPEEVRRLLPKFKHASDAAILDWQHRHKTQARHRKYAYRSRRQSTDGKFTNQEWQALCVEFGRRCLRCGGHDDLTADHIIPLVLGGSNDISNIQPLCRSCNSWKNKRTIDFRNIV